VKKKENGVVASSPMAATDRAFRALGRDEPATLLALVDLLLPDLLPEGMSLRNLTVRDPRLDIPDPSIEADAVFVQEERNQLWHLEGQGYDEEEFLDRVLRYHLGFVLRYWDKEVRTLILWMRPPPPEQRLPLLRKGSLSVAVTHLVLREASARVLVRNDQTACFAPAADDEGRGHEVVCQQTVAVLRESGASLRRWQMAAVAARSHSKERYHAMVRAMEHAGVRSVIIEDLLKIGEEFGIEKGLQQGIERGIEKGLQQGIERGIEKGIEEGRLAEGRRSVLRLLEGRGLPLSERQRQQIETCAEKSVLERWFQQAITATSADDALR
jgi:hypothetical protein